MRERRAVDGRLDLRDVVAGWMVYGAVFSGLGLASIVQVAIFG